MKRSTALFSLACLSAFVLIGFACSKENNVVADGSGICATGQYNCKGDLLQVCNAARTGWDDLETCAAGTCVQGESSCHKAEAGVGGSAGSAGSAGSGGAAGGGGTSGAGGTAGTAGAGGGTGGTGGDPLDAGPEAEAEAAPPPNYDTVQKFCNAYASAECSDAMLAACGVTKTQCQQKRAPYCINSVPNADAGIHYREQASGECVAAVAQAYSDAVITIDEIRSVDAICEKVFGGSYEAGAACKDNQYCNTDEDLKCWDMPWFPCSDGICAVETILDAGQGCFDAGTSCPEGYYCDLIDSGVCKAVPKENETCRSDCNIKIPCGKDLKCKLVDGGQKCVALLVDGMKCVNLQECAGGLCLKSTVDSGTTCASQYEYGAGNPYCADFGK